MTLDELHEWVFDELGFCGCGDPEGATDFMRQVLLAIRKRHDDNDDSEGSQEIWNKNSEVLRELIGLERHPAMAWTYLYFLDSKGLLEHGGNCSGSWLTQKGEDVLDALIKYDSGSIIENELDILDAVEVV